jgi:uncharacterized protein YkwD
MKRVSSFLILAALITAMLGCGGGAVGAIECDVTITSTAGGSVTTPGEGTFTYDEDEVVNLLAEVEDGYQFINWTGDVDSIDNVNAASTTIIMDGDYSITANFETYEMRGEYSIIYIPSTIKVMMDNDSVEIMNLDEYVKGVVAAEMGSDWPIEALKAQAVAARTFAVSNTHHDHCNVDVCTDPNCCQAWKGPPYDATIVDSVTSTCNEVITYNGTIIREALFFSHCDGHTRNSEDYNGWDYVPYLRGVSCGCADAYGWTDHNSHGVGMCQYGARVMAEQDFSYIDILKHYYSGVAITPAHTGQIVVKLCSPAELRVYDSQERVTGLVDGEVKNEIPYSDYHDHTVTISLPSGSYRYEIAGLGEGTYGLDIASIEDDEATSFIATDIPVASGAVHHYTIEWDVLAKEEEGVTVQVDEGGDDTVDYTLKAGSSLNGYEFVPSTQYDLSISSTAGGSVTTPNEGTSVYEAGAVVSLVATPYSGYQFINWTGDVGTIADINTASTTITINGDYSITANFEHIPLEQFGLTISSTVGGSIITPGEGTFGCDVGVVVILVASPSNGYQFINWTGNVSTIANVNAAITTITMHDDYSITANFEELPEYDLTIATTAGGSVILPGEGAFTYGPGTVVSLAANPASGYQFVNWTGNVGTIANVSAASTTITMNDSYSITANFEAIPAGQYSLTISSTTGGSVTLPGEGTFAYDDGTVISLAANPTSGYQFVNWTGDVGTIANVNAVSTTIIMNGDYSITANFEAVPANQYSLIISSTTGGSVTAPGEGTNTYAEGTVVSLVATPATGYQFDSWMGDVGTIANINAASTTITMNDSYSIHAIFSEEPSSPPGISYTEAEAEQLIIVLVNVERQQFGLPTLSQDPLLTSLAREHSTSMVVNNFFSHARYPGERPFSYGQPPGTIRGENIAMMPTRQVIPGPYLSLQEICEWALSIWMSSSGHRQNILEPRYTKTGVGVAFSEEGDYLYITQMFEGAY